MSTTLIRGASVFDGYRLVDPTDYGPRFRIDELTLFADEGRI